MLQLRIGSKFTVISKVRSKVNYFLRLGQRLLFFLNGGSNGTNTGLHNRNAILF